MYTLIGGINSFSGLIIGTAVLIFIPEVFRRLKEFAPYTSAIILFIVIYLMPRGLVSLPRAEATIQRTSPRSGRNKGDLRIS